MFKQLAQSFFEYKTTPEKVFRIEDPDETGVINLQRVYEVIKAYLGQRASIAEVRMLAEKIDTSRNGQIEQIEFCSKLEPLCK